MSLATVAPAFAASPIACPIVPATGSWTTTTSGTLGPVNSGGFAWEDDKWIVWRDNGSNSASLTFTSTSPEMTVVPGAKYDISFPFHWGYGGGSASASTAGTFDVLFNGVSQKSLTTRAAGLPSGWTTQSFTYVVPAGTTKLTIVYRYVLTPRTRASSDDIVVRPLSFGNCAR